MYVCQYPSVDGHDGIVYILLCSDEHRILFSDNRRGPRKAFRGGPPLPGRYRRRRHPVLHGDASWKLNKI